MPSIPQVKLRKQAVIIYQFTSNCLEIPKEIISATLLQMTLSCYNPRLPQKAISPGWRRRIGGCVFFFEAHLVPGDRQNVPAGVQIEYLMGHSRREKSIDSAFDFP
jgi:hypothetical protein